MRVCFLIVTLFVSAALAQPAREVSREQVKALLKKIQKEKTLCSQKSSPKPTVCRSKKLLLAMEGLLQSYLTLQTRSDQVVAKNAYLTKQTGILKDELKDSESPKLPGYEKCFKTYLLKDLLLELGIPENGSSVYSKHPIPGGEGSCWTNSKRKKEMSVDLCNYPLAITLETRGTSVKRLKEYLFSLNGCDLLSITSTDSIGGKSRQTFITYDQCLYQWNKRTADASMSASQVALMEDTIGFCFREHLLPPRTDAHGRANPLIRRPATVPTSGPK